MGLFCQRSQLTNCVLSNYGEKNGIIQLRKNKQTKIIFEESAVLFVVSSNRGNRSDNIIHFNPSYS